jgi:hypothetical protein
VTNYPRSAYGTVNVNAGYPANGDFAAWGSHRWPQGVPATLLGKTNYTSKSSGQLLTVIMRKEIVPLWNLAFEIMDRKYGYPVFSSRGGEAWGPWGYSNRPIANTQRASGHSGALSVDCNAPYNPYSLTFQSDMPPNMVKDLESLFFYWGGRYQGQKYDPMHYGFCRGPGDVATAISRAKSILGQSQTPAPPASEDDVTPADIDAIANAVVKKLQGTAVPAFNDPATPGKPVNVSFWNLLPKLGNWAAVTNYNVNGLANKPQT